MKYFFILLIILTSSLSYSQQKPQAGDEIAFLDELGKKAVATQQDALNLYEMVIGEKPVPLPGESAKDTPLKKGFIALIVAENLNLTDSIIYKYFKNQRYAFRVCVAHNLLNTDGSENDLMSGEELIEFLTLASEYKEKGAAK